MIDDDNTTAASSPSPCSPSQWRAPTFFAHSPLPKPSIINQTILKPRPTGSVGLSDPIVSELRRKKLDIVNRLHSLGTQRDIDLPSIVVIGSQSVGKSSLIESISGISLPRSSGTCTRCPTECHLRRVDEPWQCIVSLRFLTDEHGQPFDVAKNIQFGQPIKNPKDVEKRLRKAQLAILNPSVHSQVFLEDNSSQFVTNPLNFSNNTVCLEIKGPDVTDLSFCDLPGLIASVTDGGRDEDVEEVRELVSTYIQNPSSIILLTVACEVDFETQGAYRLAKKYDPEGIRTIGVLTKPDRIPEGEHSRWLKLIRNESSPLQNGWFCVKQLSTLELEKNLSFEEASRFCENFFKTDSWNRLDSKYQKRLGTKAVTAKLNQFLMDVISKRIPEIMQELQDMVQQTKKEIQDLPLPPSADPILELMHLINEFCDALYNQSKGIYLEGDDEINGLPLPSGNQFEAIKIQQREFRETIHSTAPKFKPHARDTVLLHPHGLIPPESDKSSDSGESTHSMSSEEVMYVDDISKMITRAITRELPGFSPFHVIQKLITLYTDKWSVPALNLLDGIFHTVMGHVTRLIQTYFERYTTGGLYHAVKNLVHEYMQDRKENVEKQLKWLLKLESGAFTVNDALFMKYKRGYSNRHERTRKFYKMQGDVDASALTVMTTVEAYFQVAYRRFVDNIPSAIDHELVRIDKRSLQEVLCKGLKLTDPHANETCARLMAEPAGISELREELNGRLERLRKAQMELMVV